MDSDTGALSAPPNLPALDGVSLKALWEPLVGRPVRIDNDASLAALGEFQYGAGKDAAAAGTPPQTLVYVTVSTGIGGGVVHRGQVFQGAAGLAGEVGHTCIDRSESAPPCQCGSRGCLEASASGTGIARSARAALARRGPLVSPWPVADVESVTSKDTAHAAGKGDPLAVEIFEDVVQALSVGLTNTVHLFNPDLLVLGGGVTLGLTDLGLIPRLEQMIQQPRDERRAPGIPVCDQQTGRQRRNGGSRGLGLEQYGRLTVERQMPWPAVDGYSGTWNPVSAAQACTPRRKAKAPMGAMTACRDSSISWGEAPSSRAIRTWA